MSDSTVHEGGSRQRSKWPAIAVIFLGVPLLLFALAISSVGTPPYNDIFQGPVGTVEILGFVFPFLENYQYELLYVIIGFINFACFLSYFYNSHQRTDAGTLASAAFSSLISFAISVIYILLLFNSNGWGSDFVNDYAAYFFQYVVVVPTILLFVILLAVGYGLKRFRPSNPASGEAGQVGTGHRSLKHSAIPTWLSLVFGSWVGLIWASLISLPIGVGFAVAGGSMLGGLFAVPIWGTIWGFVGLKRQRQSAVSRHGISLVKEDENISRRVHALASQAGLNTMPWVGVMPHNNAYAIGSGPNDALVVIGQPLIDGLSESEVDSIIGHELGHIINNDMRRMGFARSFQNSLVWYLAFSRTVQGWGRWFLTWASELFVLGLSRKREYWADAIGAALTSKETMISALEKIHNEAPALSDFERTHARLMFRGVTGSLFSTHPTLEERRSALQKETYLRRLPPLKRASSVSAVPGTPPALENIGYAKPE